MSDDRYLYPTPSNVQIEMLIFTNNQILMVFYTVAHAWEFRIISSDVLGLWQEGDLLHSRRGVKSG